jgi:CRP-like cAMP-binding protein
VHSKDRSQAVQPEERRDIDCRAINNGILTSIPENEYRSLRPHLEFIDLHHHAILHEPGQKLEFAYFPNAGLISLVVAMENGKTVEVGVVGNEGAAGIPSAVCLTRSPLREMVQVTGEGFRVKAAVLQRILHAAPEFQMMLSRYAVIQGAQVAQTAACNRLHDVEQRLARWLLMAQDRVDADFLPITHDLLATMLGTDRPSVSLAAGILQKRKCIKYTRGAVKVLNRRKLESSACECYAVIRDFNTEIALR